MGKVILLCVLLIPFAAFAGTECRVVEYPDHYEAICTGDPQRKTESSTPSITFTQHQQPLQEQILVQEETFAALQARQEQASKDGEMGIDRSDLGKRHGEVWLKTIPRL
jgi:hypothetical protein